MAAVGGQNKLLKSGRVPWVVLRMHICGRGEGSREGHQGQVQGEYGSCGGPEQDHEVTIRGAGVLGCAMCACLCEMHLGVGGSGLTCSSGGALMPPACLFP